jgi:hypothetical protein
MEDRIKSANYHQMFNSWAFKDFLKWLEERVEHYEGLCASANPQSREHWEAYFRSWQERKLVLREILQHIEDNKQQIKEQEENERSSEPALPISTSNNSTFLPGY